MRVAIVGCGFVSDAHVACLNRLKDVEVVAVVDCDDSSAQRLADKFAITHRFRDAESMYEAVSPDAVHILTPPQTHAELSLAAMRRGCQVLLEKPMAPCAAEAQAIWSGAENYSASLSICHNFLFLPCIIAARRLVDDGSLGEIVSVDVSWRPPARGFNVPWTADLPGGALHEIVPHAVYLQRAFVGEMTEIIGVSRRGGNRYGAVCEMRVLLEAEYGTSQIEVSPGGAPKQFLMHVHGTKMTLHIDLGANTLIKIRKLGDGKVFKALMNIDQAAQLVGATAQNAFSMLGGNISNGHFALIKSFYDGLQDGTELPVSGEDGYRTVATLDQVWDH